MAGPASLHLVDGASVTEPVRRRFPSRRAG